MLTEHSADTNNRSSKTITLLLLGLLVFFAGITLPYLSDYPQIELAQMMIAAPAYKLASEGVYGSDMYRGFFRADAHNYDHMPVYALPMAVAFKLFGLNVLAARSLSVFYGILVIVLSFLLGRRLFDARVGLAAAGVLCLLRLGNVPYASGIPLADIARIIRFDILVPVWVLASCLIFLWAYKDEVYWSYFLAGLLAGVAGLTHVYGAFILVVLLVMLFWQKGRDALRHPALYLVMGGWITAVIPFLLYIAQDPVAYHGQMMRHQQRLDFFNPWFYIDNLIHEPWRFLSWFGGSFRQAILWPRLGIWLFPIGLIGANILLWQRIRRFGRLEDRFLFISLPLLWLLLASVIALKRYVYITLLLPFFALQLGLLITWLWSRVKGHRPLTLAVFIVSGLLFLESASGIVQNLQTAKTTTPYMTLMEEIKTAIPPGSRLLANGAYWLGLQAYDFYSLDLIFVMTGERFGYDPQPTVADVINGIDPDFVVIAEDLLKMYIRQPEQLPNQETIEQFRALDEYLTTTCHQVQILETSGYGTIWVLHCP